MMNTQAKNKRLLEKKQEVKRLKRMIGRTESLKRRVMPLKGTRMQQRKNESVLKEKKQMHLERKREEP